MFFVFMTMRLSFNLYIKYTGFSFLLEEYPSKYESEYHLMLHVNVSDYLKIIPSYKYIWGRSGHSEYIYKNLVQIYL